MTAFVHPDEVRARFSRAMSDMYREEVPQYGALIDLVASVNDQVLAAQPALARAMAQADELARLDVERHGAIRVGTPQELSTLRRLFAVMGMEAVGYYDLSVAGVPVHSTAFRPVTSTSLNRNPFRVFTSLLRLDLIADQALRDEAAAILAKRHIFTARALALIALCESVGGLTDAEATEFVNEALETFRWHSDATVDAATYDKLHKAHRLIADVVCFKGPHINHLTPRTLDIDAAQAGIPAHGMAAKEVVEGPPRRNCPILLRQTSFKALQEKVNFPGGDGSDQGTHTARFGEIEQRGVALTRKGRALYDELLAQVRSMDSAGSAGAHYQDRLQSAFAAFPDTHEAMRQQGLAFYRYVLQNADADADVAADAAIDALVAAGVVRAEPIVYEDFLPVSAAGIFQSNLGGEAQKHYAANQAQQAFEVDLGAQVYDEIALYQSMQDESLQAVRASLAANAAESVA